VKNPWIVAAVVCASLFMALVVARLTGMLQFYRIPTTSMKPTLEVGANIITSNLVKPETGDVVIFSRISDQFDGVENPGQKITCTFRLVAKGGDKLQIKNGLVYINGRYADDSTRLIFYYTFPASKYEDVLVLLKIDDAKLAEYDWINYSADSIVAALSYSQYNKVKLIAPVRKFTFPKNDNEVLYQDNPSKKWSSDNYGPINIPQNTCFLLGDNRNAAKDSRYVGPIPLNDMKGVMIGKF
jgi:signal peptidase I